jgi:hypothetical protein
VQRGQQPFGTAAGVGIGGVLQQHGVLVTAEAGQHLARPQRLAQPPADLAQEVVADGVAQGVVDLLEPVEVEEEHVHAVTAARALSSWLRNSTRLGSPVTGSRTACWAANCALASDMATLTWSAKVQQRLLLGLAERVRCPR